MKQMKHDLELETQIHGMKWSMKWNEPRDYPPFMGSSSEYLFSAPCVLGTFLSTFYISSCIIQSLQQPCVLQTISSFFSGGKIEAQSG